MRRFLKVFCSVLCSVVLAMCLMAVPAGARGVLSPEEFYEEYIDESVDVDGYPAHQPYQCYDLWAQFVMDQYGTKYPIVISGCAREIWYNFEGLGLDEYFTKVEGKPRDGDWAIWCWSDNSSYSHVGMFRKDHGNGYVTVLHQNFLGQDWVSQDKLSDEKIVGYIRPIVYEDGYEKRDEKEKMKEVGDVDFSLSEREVKVGEEVTFEFYANGATSYTVKIYKDDSRIDNKDCGRKKAYTRSFSEPGDYYAFVKASNEDDFANSRKISFQVVPKPREDEPSRGGPITRDTGIEDTSPEPAQIPGTGVPSDASSMGVAARPVSVTVNGSLLAFDQAPVVSNGRTMVPMRAIFEALEATVDWEIGKQRVTAKRDDTTIVITVGSNLALVNGKEFALDVPPQLVNNRTLVPVRFISESLGAQVDWVISSQTVAINQVASKD